MAFPNASERNAVQGTNVLPPGTSDGESVVLPVFDPASFREEWEGTIKIVTGMDDEGHNEEDGVKTGWSLDAMIQDSQDELNSALQAIETRFDAKLEAQKQEILSIFNGKMEDLQGSIDQKNVSRN